MAGEDATIKLGYDGKKVEAGFAALESRSNQASQKIEGNFSRLSSGAGNMLGQALALTGGISAVRSFAAEMGHVNDMAQRFGVTTDEIQKVGNAAQLAGTDLDSVAKILSRLTVEAAKGNESFAALGISATDFASASLDQQVLMLARAFEAANGDQTKSIELMDLLGNKGQSILPLLATGVADLNTQFSEIPIVVGASVESMAALDDAFDSSSQVIKSWAGTVVTAIQDFAAEMTGIYAQAQGLGDANEIIKGYKEDQKPKPREKKKPFDPEEFQKSQGGAPVKDQVAAAAERRARAAADLELDMQIADAKDKGNAALAASLEREKKVRADQRRIVNQVGIDGAEARRVAEQLNPDTDPDAKRKRDEQQRKRENIQSLADDLAIAGERNPRRKAKLEREKTINEATARIEKDTGLDPARARAAAEALNPDPAKAARIRGYSGAQRAGNQFLNRSLLDDPIFGKDRRMARPRNSAAFNDFFGSKKNGTDLGGGNARVQLAEGTDIKSLLAEIRDVMKNLSAE